MIYNKYILTILFTIISTAALASNSGGASSEPDWAKNIMFFYLMALPIILILFGSIWKGANMDYRMEDEAKDDNSEK